MKKGDVVWVNEKTVRGTPLNHEWYGKIMTITKSDTVAVKDINPDSIYVNDVFYRMLSQLELKEVNNGNEKR